MAAKTWSKKIGTLNFLILHTKIPRNCNEIALGTPISKNYIIIRTTVFIKAKQLCNPWGMGLEVFLYTYNNIDDIMQP